MKRFSAILIIIIGGSIVLVSMISGIYVFAGGMYEDLYEVPFNISSIQTDLESKEFFLQGGNKIIVSLKLPDRQIENRNYIVEARLLDRKGNVVKKSSEDFSFGYSRNSAGKGQYYNILEYDVKDDFTGKLFCSAGGEWKAPYDGLIVIRKSNPLKIPLKQVSEVILGAIIAALGIVFLPKRSA